MNGTRRTLLQKISLISSCMEIGHQRYLFVVGTIVVLDQVTKYLIDSSMRLYQSEELISGVLALTYVRNTGAAFGLLAHAPAWFRQPFFYLTTGVAIVILGLFLRRLGKQERLARLSIVAILGGALGNLIDRIRFGYVIDFLDVSWQGYHWPAFNVADSCITLGVLGLLWSSVRGTPPSPQPSPPAQPPG